MPHILENVRNPQKFARAYFTYLSYRIALHKHSRCHTYFRRSWTTHSDLRSPKATRRRSIIPRALFFLSDLKLITQIDLC
jgi:hypothetical protein